MTQIGLGQAFLYGYANGNRVQIANTVEQICAFIMKHGSEFARITNILDMLEIEIFRGFITYCADQEFLRTQLIPALAPMQIGESEVPEFVPYVSKDGKLISNVRFKSAAGHSLYTLDFEDGYPVPYERLSGYFPSEESVKEAYPNSISLDEAVRQAVEKGWI